MSSDIYVVMIDCPQDNVLGNYWVGNGGGWVGFTKWVDGSDDFWRPPPLGCLHTGAEGAEDYVLPIL